MASTSSLLLGVDTGGTYTDAVVLDASTRRVIDSAKALTTRADLSVGVSNALSAIAGSFDPVDVELVSISTTLATNAVVEGHGSAVLAVVVGFDDNMVARTGIGDAFGDVIIVRIDGGHDHYGNEQAPLDTAALAAALDEYGSAVSAVAVASTFAVRNPAHEYAVRDAVIASTALPVTVSSSLSESLDAPRRALTTALNARLLSRVTGLIEAVQRSLDSLGVQAPLMVAKGDGSLAAADAVARRPIETILSGPAASLVGAATLTGEGDFVLSDIGGTTTDVGQLRGGRPRLVPDGARVGPWRTMVEAIDVRTTGLGGDSEVATDKSAISLGPQRRIPVSLLGVEHPEIERLLRAELADPGSRDLAAAFVVPVAHGDLSDLTDMESRIIGRLESDGPTRLADAAPGAVERRAVQRLSLRGVLQLAGFTPSDAAHVLGLQANWSTGAARAAGELMAWYVGEPVEAFCRRVFEEMVRRSAACVLEVSAGDVLGGASQLLSNPLVEAALSGGGTLGDINVALSSDKPIIAVGGPAGVYYGDVAERLGAMLVLPSKFEVANAVGAAAGELVTRVTAEVQSDGPGQFRVITVEGTTPVNEPTLALEAAQAQARALADALLAEAAAGLDTVGEPRELIDIERHDSPDALGDEGLYAATIRLELRARPIGG